MQRKLTGNTRYRTETRWFKKPLLVLQVEVHVVGDDLENLAGRIETVDVDYTYFKDAATEDLLNTKMATKIASMF